MLLATENRAKARELVALFEGISYQIVTPGEVGISLKVPETGDTLEENARQKAVAYAETSKLLTLADDSGLEVDALGGAPGVRSRRFAGKEASDEERMALLLEKLKGVEWEKRTARFRCVMAIAGPQKTVRLCEGECRGIIAFEPVGKSGFGYDPVFYLPELGKTMGELPPGVKNEISHRARAAQKAREVLSKMTNDEIRMTN